MSQTGNYIGLSKLTESIKFDGAKVIFNGKDITDGFVITEEKDKFILTAKKSIHGGQQFIFNKPIPPTH